MVGDLSLLITSRLTPGMTNVALLKGNIFWFGPVSSMWPFPVIVPACYRNITTHRPLPETNTHINCDYSRSAVSSQKWKMQSMDIPEAFGAHERPRERSRCTILDFSCRRIDINKNLGVSANANATEFSS